MNNRNRQRNPYRSPAQRWTRLAFWAAVCVGIGFAYFNILPYTQAVRLLNKTVDNGFIQLISVLPVVNGIAATIGAGIHWILGFLVWALIQSIELFPIVLKHDPKFLEKVIQDAEGANRFDIKEDDPPSLQALKRWYNQFPYLTFGRAITYAIFAYTIDFCIAFFTYPPVKGDLFDFGFILMSGQFDQLDWRNLTSLLVTLFVIEVIFLFLLWLDKITYYMKTAHNIPFRR
ncbi:hypothetical protein LC593_10515 [Nostoc sp. CHAB 5844]|nr:hypothetical protein [Nostoc sp. CHAB 5844]